MPKIDEANIDKIRLKEQGSAPSSPASDYGYLYIKTDGKIYFKNDAGTEVCLSDALQSPLSADLNFNSHKGTNLTDPTSSQDAATKAYVDGLALNVGKRLSVRVATTANITISTALKNGDTLDGVTLATGDLVLVKNQSSGEENGIYVVGVSPARSSEYDAYNEHPGSLIAVEEGSTNADTLWLCTSNEGGTINSTSISFSAFTVSNNIDDTAYDATSWNGDTTHAPSKNAVRDKIESLGSGLTADQADPYGTHHRLSGSSGDDDEFSSNTAGSYTEVDPTGSTTWVIANHVLSCIFSGQSSADYGAFLKAMTLADGEWFETRIKALAKDANYTVVGIVVTDGTGNTSNAISAQILTSSGGAVLLESYKGTLTNMSTVIVSTSLMRREAFAGIRIRLRRVSSSSFIAEVSTDGGAQWTSFGNAGGDPGFTPTHAGVFVSVYGGSNTGIAQFDYIRHMA